MYQLPTTMLEPARALSTVPPATGLTADGGGYRDSPFESLFARVQDGQDTSTQHVLLSLDPITRGHVSTVDMLRLQVSVGTWQVKTQLIAQVADGVGRSIQTLTQRS
jgi:hypothetical protein